MDGEKMIKKQHIEDLEVKPALFLNLVGEENDL
jgi:hypothetical protein